MQLFKNTSIYIPLFYILLSEGYSMGGPGFTSNVSEATGC